MRHRLLAVVVILGLGLATLSIQAASASGPELTRIRIELSGTSEWQSVSFSQTLIGAYHVVSQAPGATVERGSNAIVLKGLAGSATSTTVDVLLETNPFASSFEVKLAKSRVGEAYTRLFRNNTTSTQILSLSNKQTSGECVTTSNVSRSSFVGEGYAMPRVDPRRLVLAFYYPWFQQGSFDNGPWYDTPITAYDTNDSASIAAQADLAKGAGVDGFVVSWDDVGNHTDRFDRTLAAARARSMVVSPLIELLHWRTSSGFNVSGIVSTIKLALERSGDAAFLKVGSKPVLFVFGASHMGPDLWKSVVSGVAASGYDAFYIGEPPDPNYGFNGSYAYNPNGLDQHEMLERNTGYMRTLRYAAQVNPSTRQRLWAATVSPGQNLSYFNPLFPKNEAREDGARYDMTWGAALSSDPEWILVTSWNEWYEATHIVPSDRFGYTAVNQTAGWSAGFHNPSGGGGEPDGGALLPKIRIPLEFSVGR